MGLWLVKSYSAASLKNGVKSEICSATSSSVTVHVCITCDLLCAMRLYFWGQVRSTWTDYTFPCLFVCLLVWVSVNAVTVPNNTNKYLFACFDPDLPSLPPPSLVCSVGNHMGNQNYGDWKNFTFFTPFNQADHYHSYCLITDFSNQNEVRTPCTSSHPLLVLPPPPTLPRSRYGVVWERVLQNQCQTLALRLHHAIYCYKRTMHSQTSDLGCRAWC